MPGTTKTRYEVTVKLKRTEEKPYNEFQIQYIVTETVDASGESKKQESDRTLVCTERLGLNLDWLHSDCAPVDQTPNRKRKAEIRELHVNFPYWGHLIYNSIQEFNASNTRRCRKLVYDLRHGEADHNAWKSLFKKIDPLLWTKVKRNLSHPYIHKNKSLLYLEP